MNKKYLIFGLACLAAGAIGAYHTKVTKAPKTVPQAYKEIVQLERDYEKLKAIELNNPLEFIAQEDSPLEIKNLELKIREDLKEQEASKQKVITTLKTKIDSLENFPEVKEYYQKQEEVEPYSEFYGTILVVGLFSALGGLASKK